MTAPAALPPFAAGFAAADEAAWRALAGRVLKGAPFERLIAKTADGIEIQPLYARPVNAGPRSFSSTPGRWTLFARIDHPGAPAANRQALDDLAQGADGLQIIFSGSANAFGFGLPADARGLLQVLDGVDPAVTAFDLDAGGNGHEISETLARFIIGSGLDPASARVSFGIDPIGAGVLNGASVPAWQALAPAFAAGAMSLAKCGFAGPFCAADGRIIHAAGGSEAQELAFALSAALAYLRALEAAGLPLDTAAKAIAFRMAADADQFLTIAKFRALRLLWARVENACGLKPHAIQIHAATAWRMMTRREPSVNLLRATVAAFAVAAGGADAISVLPYTQAIGLPDAIARRLALNTQHILLEEAHIAKVADPAAGSGGIEALTESLCRRGWACFQMLERAGGAGHPAACAALAKDVADVHAHRLHAIATRRDPITAISAFPNIHEQPAAVLIATPDEFFPASAFKPVRNAAAFEALRDRAESLPQRPLVFLANIGPLSAFQARAAFAGHLFEAGGIEAVSNPGFESPETMAAAFADSGANIACLCSSDMLYAQSALSFAGALRSAGARMIYLAGRPGHDEKTQHEAGVKRYIFTGCDTLAVLEEALTFYREV